MKRLFPILLIGGLALVGCQSNQADGDASAEYDGYGAAMTEAETTPAQSVAADAKQYEGKPVKVKGTVRRVCQKKGCWLTLDTGDGPSMRVMVARSDSGYVFTVPKDIDGREAVVRGRLKQVSLSDQARRHMTKDDGAALDSTAMPEHELQISADAVLVKKQATAG